MQIQGKCLSMELTQIHFITNPCNITVVKMLLDYHNFLFFVAFTGFFTNDYDQYVHYR